MSTRIPFLDDLKADLLTHAPEDVAFAPARAGGPRRHRGPIVAVAAFGVVLVLGGLVTWLAVGRDRPDGFAGPHLIEWHLRALFETPGDPTGLITSVEALEGVVETQYFPDAAVPFPPPPLPEGVEVTTLTVPEGGPVSIETATLLVRLDDPARAEEAAAAIRRIGDVWTVLYAEAVAVGRAEGYFAWAADGATVLRQRPLVLQPAPGPEPRFDPSGLGREIVLVPGQPGEVTDAVLYRGLLTWEDPGREDVGFAPRRDESRPILHIGSDPEGAGRLIVFAASDDGWCETLGGGGACGRFADSGYGFASWGSDGYLTAWVPVSTAVVALAVAGEEPRWQRPTAGWALFPVRVAGWEDELSATLEAYDPDGNLIGRWET